jgi:hydroxyacylglutathione hydrolase
MINCIRILKDNYIWMIINNINKKISIIDPGLAMPIIKWLNKYNYHLSEILITHHHNDHVEGLEELSLLYNPKIYAYKTSSIPYITHFLEDGDVFRLDSNNKFCTIQYTPGHTLDHCIYYIENKLFTGDTLFAGGCGKVIEGSYKDMWHSLKKISTYPLNTKIYCSHEYTVQNLLFGLTIFPKNKYIKNRLYTLKGNKSNTLPSSIAIELKTNIFLFTCINTSISIIESIDNFRKLRIIKDNYVL